MKKIALVQILLVLCNLQFLQGQDDDLESMLEEEIGVVNEKVLGTFLSTYVLNNTSVEMLNKHGLNIRVSHKFGFLNSGSENFYGFDHSSVYMGLEYGITDWLNVGIGRGTFNESVNGQMKVRIVQQASGKRNIPLTVALYGELDYQTKNYTLEDLNNDWKGRMSYTTQLLLARKFGSAFSLQLMPCYIHRNLVETTEDLNSIWSLGFGGTTKLSKRLRFNAEYFLTQDHSTSEETYYSPIAFGICYQTSRHAFELFATNSTGITTNNHIAYTTGNFWKGDICIGFNVSIIFSVKR